MLNQICDLLTVGVIPALGSRQAADAAYGEALRASALAAATTEVDTGEETEDSISSASDIQTTQQSILRLNRPQRGRD